MFRLLITKSENPSIGVLRHFANEVIFSIKFGFPEILANQKPLPQINER